ncbi:MAG: T9SS type A sorting domain-containing protein [Bacteroidota bacterium]
MKSKILFLATTLHIIFYILPITSLAQDNEGGTPYSIEQQLNDDLLTAVSTPPFDFAPLIALSEQRVKQGTYELTDRLFDVNYNLLNSGTSTTLANGDKLWKLKIVSPGAKKISLYYQNFYLPEGAKLFVYNANRTEVIGAFTSKNNEEANSNEGIFSTDHLSGEVQIVEYYEPKNVRGQGHFSIFRVAHQFKSIQINESETCQKDINCPDGANWQNEKKGVVRIMVVIGSNAGWCSGSLVNNTAQDCKKYILTAMHCALDDQDVETTAFSQWKFYFDFEKSGCATGTAPSKVKTGCTRRAGAVDGGGSGSDFLLVEITSTTFPTGVTPYYNGWTRATTVSQGGVGIHHPASDCKKISTFTTTPTSTSWGFQVPNTHWKFVWQSGHGSTEGGSSGSPVFNSSGLIFGTLTGGGSCCVLNGCGFSNSGPTQSDSYGKLSYHWTSNGTTSSRQLKPWLDPINSGVTTLAGSFVCIPASVEDNLLDSRVNIYPNPSNGSFNVSIELTKTNDIDITVYNIVGQEVSHKKIDNTLGGTFTMDLTNNADGVYFIHIKTNNYSVVKNAVLLGSK